MKERVLFITSSYPRFEGDYAGHFVQAEVQELCAQGAEVTVLCAGKLMNGPSRRASVQLLSLGGAQLFDHPGALLRLREKPWRLFGLLSASFRLQRLRKTLQPFDRVVAHWLLPCALPWALPFVHQNTRFEVVVHGSDLRLLLRFPQWMQTSMLQRLMRQKAHLRFVSQELLDSLRNNKLEPRLKEWLRKSEVRPASLAPLTLPTKSEARKLLSLHPESRVAVVVSRLIEQKRIRVALTALELLPDFRCYLIGSGPLADELKREFPNIFHLGELNYKSTQLWIRAADLLVSASLSEGAPTVIREALRAETLVVSPAISDLALWQKNSQLLHLVTARSK